jgi:N-acetylglucosamine-6-sulfatase
VGAARASEGGSRGLSLPRGRIVRLALLAAVVVAAAAVPDRHALARRAADERPNIVVFETDDQTVADLRAMANVQRLEAEGTTFDNSFVSLSYCCPSRATFLTGQYAHNHGVVDNVWPAGGYYKLDSSNTLAVWLQRAGYYTVLLGKYLNEYGLHNPLEVPPGWSEWQGTPDPSTYDYLGYSINVDGELVRYGVRPQDYKTDVEAERALDIVRRRAAQPQPFFLWLTFLAPHRGLPPDPDDPQYLGTPMPAPRDRDRFANEPLPMPRSFNEADISDKPKVTHQIPISPQGVANLRELYQQRLESLLSVDEAIGRIVAQLRSMGVLDRTLIVFTSDNGYLIGEHRYAGEKVALYEPSIRVPLIVRGPGVPPGAHVRTMVANLDLAPTLVAYAHASAGRVVDGESLVPLLRDPTRSWGRDLLIESPPWRTHYVAIRTPRYIYAEYASGDRELYDLLRDPDELTSVHNDPFYAPIRRELARRLAELRTCAGADCRRGPRLAVTLRYRHGARGCVRSNLRATVTGRDARWLTRVAWSVNGGAAGRASRRPFTHALSKRMLARSGSVLRTDVALSDGRSVTYTRLLRRC